MTKWDKAYMKTAETFGSLSTAKRLQVGAIVVKDNRIVSIGYNGMPSGWSNECEDEVITEYESYTDSALVTKPEVIHAEANAIAKLARSTESGEGATMYITHAPCIECAKMIYTSGITKVYYKNEYRSEDGIEFLRKCNVRINKYDI